MLYFAYGSNLNLTQMKRRCPDSVPVANVKLKDYKLVFNRVADIVESAKDVVYGAIYEVSARDIRNLDVYEGYPRLYTKMGVMVEDDWGKRYKAFVYVMVIKEVGEPLESYYQTIIEGYNDWNLPMKSLNIVRRIR